MKATRVDLTDKRFGRLTVLEWSGGSQSAWTCACDCGKRKDVAGGSLRSGKTQSCGCLRSETVSRRFRLPDMTGQVFGRLVVTGSTGIRGGESFWSCECTCGSRIEVRGWMLRDGSTQSCGCLHRERVRADRTDSPTYGAIHSRLRAQRGLASALSCTDCSRPADQWSYDHADAAALTSDQGHRYSLNLGHYGPRCFSCHRVFDSAHGGAA